MKLKTYYLQTLNYSFFSFFIGLSVGCITSLFGQILITISNFREVYPLYLLPFLAIAGLLITYSYQKYFKNTYSGMELIFLVGNNNEKKIPMRMVPLVIFATWLTHLFGGSAGREGVAVQIGATIGHSFSKLTPQKDDSNILLIAGMAAGFSGLFQTPIASIFFALEVLVVGKIEVRALLPVTIAAFTANITSSLLGLEKFTATIENPGIFTLHSIWKLVVIGLIFGIVGGLFALSLKFVKNWVVNFFVNPYKRIFFIGIILSILLLLFHTGRYSGLGTNLINNSFGSGFIFNYDWLLKIIFTILTLSAGFQGGEVTPLFAIGASLGVILAPIVGLPVTFVAALGYIGIFSSATNTFISPLFIGAEVFGYQYFPFYFIVVIIAYIFNGNQTIYIGQKSLD